MAEILFMILMLWELLLKLEHIVIGLMKIITKIIEGNYLNQLKLFWHSSPIHTVIYFFMIYLTTV
jgi:hypothetical protein